MQNLTRTRFRNEQILPFDKGPQIQPQQGQRDQEQTPSRRSRCCASVPGVHQAAAGLDAKTSAVFVSHLVRRHVELTKRNVSKALHTMIPNPSVFVAA
jgi:hypothetical protein